MEVIDQTKATFDGPDPKCSKVSIGGIGCRARIGSSLNATLAGIILVIVIIAALQQNARKQMGGEN